jgi:hypothetical protein
VAGPGLADDALPGSNRCVKTSKLCSIVVTVRWDNIAIGPAPRPAGTDSESPRPGAPAAPADLVLFGRREAVARTFDTPGFRGITFFEVHAKSIINRVPEASRMPFRWTINPYRGCSHACFLLLCPADAHVPGPGLRP